MGIATFGWPALNHVRSASAFAAGSRAGELGPEQLQNDHGASATAWQTAAGVLTPEAGAWVQFATDGARTWRAVSLHRTNLTAAARWRVRIGGADCVAPPMPLPTDTSAGASRGEATTRTGSVAGPGGSTATAYSNGAGGAYVRPGVFRVVAGYTYEIAMWMRRASGPSTAGWIFSIVSPEPGGSVFVRLAMVHTQQDDGWHFYIHQWTPSATGMATISTMVNTGPLDFELGPATLRQVPEFDSTLIPAAVQPGYGQCVLPLPEAVSGALCRIDLSDPGNPDGFLNVPLLYAGDSWTPLRNISWDSAPGREAEVDEVVTRGGQEFPQQRFARRSWDISHQALGRGEVWPRLAEMLRSAEGGGNCLFVPDPAGAEIARETVFGRLKSNSGFSYPYQTLERRAWRGTITERL